MGQSCQSERNRRRTFFPLCFSFFLVSLCQTLSAYVGKLIWCPPPLILAYGFQIPVVLVGNKCDKKEGRQVSQADGKAMARKFHSCIFLESSAKQNTNIEPIFVELVRAIWKKEGKPNDDVDIDRGCVLL